MNVTTSRARRSFAAVVLAASTVAGAVSVAAPAANAAVLNTAVVTSSNTGSSSATIELYRWTSTGWVVEKRGTTAASGAATFRAVRGDAYYAWGTAKAAVYFDANGYTRTCHFYTRSNPNGQYVPAGTTRTLAFYQAWNTCGA